jgi:hypothetical protein
VDETPQARFDPPGQDGQTSSPEPGFLDGPGDIKKSAIQRFEMKMNS